MTTIHAENVTRRYGDVAALDGVGLQVMRGELLAVLGPNGAGKTSLIEILEGFAAPTSGTVRVLDVDPRHGDRRWRSRIGLVLQSTSLESEPTVREILTLFAGLYPAPRPVNEVLDLIDLAGESRSRVGTLSGGQQRRVDLGLAIIGRPDILFLDEPTTGLDPQARRRCWSTVSELRSDGTTVVLTTHYLDEADHLADRVVVLDSGRIVADASPERLRARAGSTIHFRIPDPGAAGDLPATLAAHLSADARTLHVSAADATAQLGDLVRWADRHRLDLAGLEVRPPTLEEAYFDLIGERSDG